MKENVDLIVNNAKVFTIDPGFSIVESFAVKDGKIIILGTSEEVMANYQSEKILDGVGKYIYPGFNDAHCHLFGYGMNLIQQADLSKAKSKEEIYPIIQEHYKKYGGEWVLGRGWDQNDWMIKEFPDKSKLDELFPDVPVLLTRIDGHACWCNSKALQLGGVTSESKVTGGEVMLNNGEVTGVLIDAAVGLVRKLIPQPTEKQKLKALLAAQDKCFAAGLTSITDCGLPKGIILMMDELHQSGELKMRVNAMLSPTDENFDYFLNNGIYKTDRLRVGSIKLFADGALGSRGALMLEDYSDDPGNKGLRMEDEAYFDNICKLAYEHNYQVATHCIGDAANRYILNKYGEYLKGKNDRRWRIEHSQVVHQDDFELFGKYSIVPSIQATHCTSDMFWADERLGESRVQGAYAYQQLLDQNGWLPNGTDFPVEEIFPLNTFYSAVFRMDHEGNPEGGFQMGNALTREQTLRSMTIWVAKSSFEENEKGSLEPGKWADFVILDTDLITATPEQILEAKVLSTWSGGEKVFELKR